jgi:serine-type D-Ala-D-Ala carboxypeptidase (penicillin-binding protein 5/6)
VPFRTLGAAPGSPFDEVVGGERLAARGVPVVPAGIVAPVVDDGRAWLVAELRSGRVLAALNPHDQLPPASTIKLLTAVALLPEIDADAAYAVTDADVTVEGSRVGLVPGQRYSQDALVHGLLLASGNDAANALAQLAGGEPRALHLMAETAKRLGAFDTRATTLHGLDEPRQRTSAYDLALVARAVLNDPDLAIVVRTETYDFPGLSGKTFQIQNHNRLVGRYDGMLGLKTGFTTITGHTLVAAAERDGVRLVAVVLGAKNRAEPIASILLDWGFSQRHDIESIGHLVTPAEVAAAEAGARAQAGAPSLRPTADQQVQPDTGAVQPSGNEPVPRVSAWAWAGLVVAAVGTGIVMTRRRTNAAASTPDRRRARKD